MKYFKKAIRFIIQKVTKLFLTIYYRTQYKIICTYAGYDKKRKDAHIIIGNHSSLSDPLFASIHLKRYAVPVVNIFLYKDFWTRLAFTKLIDSIPKRKGVASTQTVRDIKKFLKQGRSILLYPEGNSSYFGENSEFTYATAKLCKKQKVDVVGIKTDGGYLASPRWAKARRHRGVIHLNYFMMITKEELETMTVDEIYEKIVSSLRFNDYEWNREHQNKYRGLNKASGIEDFIYVCPECQDVNCLFSDEDSIVCLNCGEIGYLNDYGFIEDAKFDNLVDWSHYQETFLPEIVKRELEMMGELIVVDLDDYSSKSYGSVRITIGNGELCCYGSDVDKSFNIKEMEGVQLTTRRIISFDYEGQTLVLKVDKSKILLDIINFTKENERD